MQPAFPHSGDGTSLSAILQAVDGAREARPQVPLALATLVNVEGSSYRQPGARLLVDAEQRVLAGAISGGCLEGDVAYRAQEVCATGAAVLLRYDLREDLETIWGFGAACDGIAHILLEPLQSDEWLRNAHAAMLRRTRPVLVTEFGDAHSQKVSGRHSLVEDPAVENGTLSSHVATALRTGAPYVGESAGTNVLAEPLNAPVALHIIGAGRSAEAFATIAMAMGWQVTVVDHRDALLSELHLPPGVQRLARRAEEGVRELPLDDRTVIAIVTHIFQIDSAWLAELLNYPIAYVGVLGSRNRAGRLLQHLADGGLEISPEMHRRVFAPIGLDLGGETPESIALAGIAEMEAVLHERPGGFLRSRQSPIHTRTPIPVAHFSATDATIDSCAMPADVRN